MHTVVPNLRRLGLITERTQDKYRACGIVFDGVAPQMNFPIAS
jgi:hypothetical protein